MSAQINLLSDEERRHPGTMLLRTLLGTVSLVAVAAHVLYGALAYLLLADARGSQQRAFMDRFAVEHRENAGHTGANRANIGVWRGFP